MKRDTTASPKFGELEFRLGLRKYEAVGVLETLWRFTESQAPRGDIGRWSNAQIARAIGWERDPDELILALVRAGWLDECERHGLLVHDWSDHAPESHRKRVQRANKGEQGLDGRGFWLRFPPENPGSVLEKRIAGDASADNGVRAADNGRPPVPLPNQDQDPNPNQYQEKEETRGGAGAEIVSLGEQLDPSSSGEGSPPPAAREEAAAGEQLGGSAASNGSSSRGSAAPPPREDGKEAEPPAGSVSIFGAEGARVRIERTFTGTGHDWRWLGADNLAEIWQTANGDLVDVRGEMDRALLWCAVRIDEPLDAEGSGNRSCYFKFLSGWIEREISAEKTRRARKPRGGGGRRRGEKKPEEPVETMGSRFAAAWYAQRGGNDGEPVADASANEIAAAEKYLPKLIGADPEDRDPENWGRRFASFQAKTTGCGDHPPNLTIAIRQDGDKFLAVVRKKKKQTEPPVRYNAVLWDAFDRTVDGVGGDADLIRALASPVLVADHYALAFEDDYSRTAFLTRWGDRVGWALGFDGADELGAICYVVEVEPLADLKL